MKVKTYLQESFDYDPTYGAASDSYPAGPGYFPSFPGPSAYRQGPDFVPVYGGSAGGASAAYPMPVPYPMPPQMAMPPGAQTSPPTQWPTNPGHPQGPQLDYDRGKYRHLLAQYSSPG
jgi:hypothetical protein